jgi:Ni,Fe-hydrogenase III large subunit
MRIRDFRVSLPFKGEAELDSTNTISKVEISPFEIEAHIAKDEPEAIAEVLRKLKFSGVSSAICNSESFCKVLEEISLVEISDKVEKLRIIFDELERISSHLLVLSNIARAMNLDILYSELLRQREKIAKLYFESFGNRVVIDFNVVGGIVEYNRNILRLIASTVQNITEYFEGIIEVFTNDNTIVSVLKDIGVLEESNARILGLTGPVAKASNITEDKRAERYKEYFPEYTIVKYNDGDCYARTLVRVHEISQSLDIISELVESIGAPEEVKIGKINRAGAAEYVYEQAEGQAKMTVGLGVDSRINRFELITQKKQMLKAMTGALTGSDFYDMPVIMATFNYCDFGVDWN